MSKIDYSQKIDRQLKEYFLAHRNDNDALEAYLQRRKKNKREIITSVDDPDFDAKIVRSILEQISQKKNPTEKNQ